MVISGCALPAQASVIETGETKEPPNNDSWVYPAKIKVNKFYPWSTAQFTIKVHNGSPGEKTYSVTYRNPDHIGEGYVIAPGVTKERVKIVNPNPILEGYETRNILVTIQPTQENRTAWWWVKWSWHYLGQWINPDPVMEFWINVEDTQQRGMVREALGIRVFLEVK